MATKINEFEFNRSSNYDWKNWLDGDIWQLVQGEDFEVEITSFRSVIFAAGQSRGLKVRTQFDSKSKTLTIQAYNE